MNSFVSFLTETDDILVVNAGNIDKLSPTQAYRLFQKMKSFGYDVKDANDTKKLFKRIIKRVGGEWNVEKKVFPEHYEALKATSIIQPSQNKINPNTKYFERAKRKFGITKNPAEAGFILPNGQMLNFSAGETGRRNIDHRTIESVLDYMHDSGRKNIFEFMKMGAIRIHISAPRNSSIPPYCSLHIVKELTPNQKKTILQIPVNDFHFDLYKDVDDTPKFLAYDHRRLSSAFTQIDSFFKENKNA